MRKKRLTSLLLSACMVLGMLLPSAAAVPLPGQSVNFSGNPSKALDTDQVVYEVTGSGSRKTASFETAWNELTGQYAKGGTISLIKDVKAANGSFGKGTGFSQSGTITLPTGRVVTLDLNGHSIDRALSAPLADGGVLAVYGTLTLKDSKGGGTLRGGSGSTYGGVYVRGTFNMEGGSISANTAQTQGGGLYNAGSVQLKKGSITNNNGGGVYQGGSFSLSGAVSITGNTAAGGALCNLYLPQGRTVSTIGNGLQNGARVGVSAETAPSVGASVAVASGTLAAADAQRFTSDAGHIVKLEGGRIVLQVPEPAAAVPSNEVPAASNSLPANTGSNAAAQTAPEASASAGNTVTLYSNGGSWTYGIETSRVVTVTEGMRYGDLPEPRRTGYQFDGWKGRGNTLLSPSEYVNSGESPLTAQWTANRYQVSFNLNYADAPDTPSPVTVTYQQRYGAALGLENGRLPKPTRPGYQFRGWCVKPYGGTVVTENMMVGIPKDHTLYALWLKDAEEYAVTFLSKRPVSSEEPIEQCVLVVKEKEALTLPTAEECGFTIPENQALKAWNNLADSKTPPTDYYAGRRMSFLTDTTFCAVWEDAYPVILDPNGGRWADLPEEQAETERTEYAPAGRLTSTLPQPELEGKTFAGWFDAPEGGEYVEDLPAQIASQTEDAPYTLYAYWGEGTATIPEGDNTGKARYKADSGEWSAPDDFANVWQRAATDGGTVQLLGNVTANNGSFGTGTGFHSGGALVVPINKQITLDLNGCELDRGLTQPTSTGAVIYVGYDNSKISARLTVSDTSNAKTGVITGGYSDSIGGGICVNPQAVLMLEGGSITGNTARFGGGISVTEYGEVKLQGGDISGNEATERGGGIYGYDHGWVTLESGSIKNNKAARGGGIYNVNNTFIMSGGSITDNEAEIYGAVYNDSNVKCKISGGSITDNTSTPEGLADCGSINVPIGDIAGMEISGSPVIKNNRSTTPAGATIAADLSANLVHMGGASSSWAEPFIISDLGETADIGVYRDVRDVFASCTDETTQQKALKAFKSNNSPYIVLPYSDEEVRYGLRLGEPETPQDEAEHIPADGSPTVRGTFADMWNRVTSNGGTIRLLQDIEDKDGNFGLGGTARSLHVNRNANVTIDLHGHALDRHRTQAEAAGEVIFNNGTLTIQDSRGGGKITGGYNSTVDRGGGITNTGTLILEGGSITGNHTQRYGGGIYNREAGTVEIKEGGSIIDNSVVPTNDSDEAGGGGICNVGSLTMRGGSIEKNTAQYGGGIFNAENRITESVGTLTMYGGSIEENTAEGGGGICNVAILTMHGGSIEENTAAKGGGGIFNGGFLTINNGSIKKNHANEGGGGGIGNEGILTMNGGSIEENDALTFGGGIYNDEEVTLTGGTIQGNKAESGGAIFSTYGTSDAELKGGTITGNFSETDGNVTVSIDGRMTVSGSLQIIGNKLNSGADADVWLAGGEYLTISEPGQNLKIGVRVAEGAADGTLVAQIPESFHNAGGEVFSNQGRVISQNPYNLQQLILGAFEEAEYIPSATSTNTGDKGTLAKMWVKAVADPGSTIRLLRKVTAASDNTGFGTDLNYGNGALYVPEKVSLTLDLNGCTLDRGLAEENSGAYSSVISVGRNAELTVQDETGKGKITGGRSGSAGGGITTSAGSTLKLTGGSITGNVGRQGGGVSSVGKFIMEGGSIENNTSTGTGGGVYNLGTAEIRGGTITNNSAAGLGGGIYNDPSNFKGLTVSRSPRIHSNTAVENGQTVPSDVYLLENQYITIDDLASSARIGVCVEDPETSERLVAQGDEAVTNTVQSFSNNQSYRIIVNPRNDHQLIMNHTGTCQVTLESKGGTLPDGTVNPFTVTLGNIYGYGNLPTPTYAGHTFAGWFTAETGGSEVKEDTQVPIDAVDHTLYAHWDVTHTVYLNPNGGDALTPDTLTVAEGGTYPELPTPTRTGYTFEGWFTRPEGGSEVKQGDPFNEKENQMLYAHWNPTTPGSVTITLNANYSGGTVTPGAVTSTDGKYPDLPTPTRTGYTFAGWYTAASGGTQVNAGGALVQATAHTLYAHWTQNQPDPEGIKVTLDPNGGSVSPTEITVRIGGSYTPLPIATRSNYIFDGWFTAASGGTQVTTGTMVTEPVYETLYAHWHRRSSGGGSSGGGGGGGGSSSSKDDDDDKDDRLYITATSSSGGSISPSGQTRVSRGSSKTYTITPNVGYSVSDVLVDGKSVGQRTSYTFSNITSSHTIRAAFTRTVTTPTTTPPTTTTTPPATTSTSRPGTAYNVCPKDNTCPIAPYSDAQPTAWYHDGVHYCINGGLMTGTSATTFEPNTPLSRGMLAQILYNREGKPSISSGGNSFTDVVSGAWYENAVKRTASTGLVVGYENGAYGPGDPITREQLAVVLWRHAGSPIPAVSTVPFDDYRNTREFARDAVRWAYGRGILNGKADGSLDPGGRASRAEVAQMLKNYLTT